MLIVYEIYRLVVSFISSGKQRVTGLWIPSSLGDFKYSGRCCNGKHYYIPLLFATG